MVFSVFWKWEGGVLGGEGKRVLGIIFCCGKGFLRRSHAFGGAGCAQALPRFRFRAHQLTWCHNKRWYVQVPVLDQPCR